MKKPEAHRYSIFISSVQKELAQERRSLKNYVYNDPLLNVFVSEVFFFEYLPARDQKADQAYLQQVDQCDLYVGLFANEYGNEDPDGFSPTEREFDRATDMGKIRIVFVKGGNEGTRHPKMEQLIVRPRPNSFDVGLTPSLI